MPYGYPWWQFYNPPPSPFTPGGGTFPPASPGSPVTDWSPPGQWDVWMNPPNFGTLDRNINMDPMNRGNVQSGAGDFYGDRNINPNALPPNPNQPVSGGLDPTQISFQTGGADVPWSEPAPLPSPSDTPVPPGQGLNAVSVMGDGGPIGPPMAQPPYQYNIPDNPFAPPPPATFGDVYNMPSNPFTNVVNQVLNPPAVAQPDQYGSPIGPPAADPNQYAAPAGPPMIDPGQYAGPAGPPMIDPNQYSGTTPIGPPMAPPPDPNVEVITQANPNPSITDPGITDAGGGGVAAPPGVVPDVAPAVPITGPPGFGSADFAASATPADQLPNAPGDIYATGQVGMRDASGNVIPGTALTPADAANIYNNQQFPNAVPGMPSSLSDPTNYGAVGQFFRDAAGNIVDAAGNIVRGAGDIVSNIVSNLANDPGYSSPAYLQSIGYTPGQGTGSLLPPEGFAGARGGPLPGSFAGLGSFSAGFLPNAFQEMLGRTPWTNRRPMTAEQWAQATSWENYQGNALAGVNWANWAKQTGMPTPTVMTQNPFGNNYAQYLNMWNQTRDVIAQVAAQRAAQARSGDGITRAVGPGVAGPGGAGRPATHTV